MAKSIVVMGGSFNPPTIAHHKLMKAAMEQLGANKGIFVPVSAKYLQRKMRKAGFPDEVLSEETRIAMLRAMCEEDSRLEIEDVEMKHPKGWYTLETMRYVQEKYPGAEVVCLAGSDKLEIFANAHRMIEFTNSFCYGVVTRDGDDPDAILRKNPEAWASRDRFRTIKAPEGVDGVSSTAIREWLRTGEGDISDMLHPKVMELVKEVDIWAKE